MYIQSYHRYHCFKTYLPAIWKIIAHAVGKKGGEIANKSEKYENLCSICNKVRTITEPNHTHPSSIFHSMDASHLTLVESSAEKGGYHDYESIKSLGSRKYRYR